MKYRLKFYGVLILVISLTATYLLLVFVFNWYLSDYQPPHQVIEEMIARNTRLKTWGACGGGFGLIFGTLLALTLLIANSTNEFFEDMYRGLQSILEDKTFPRLRNILIFFTLMVVILVAVSGDWELGLRDGLEFIGVFVWLVFLIATFALFSILLVDIFIKRVFDYVVDHNFEDE